MAFEVFKVFATLGLNTSDFDKGLDDSEKKASGFGSKVASGFATIGKTAAAGLAIAGGATVKLAKDSVDAYASFEQLAGGIETLFGEDAQTVMANADKAFKTAGLSANDYMETAIASSASMINALDGDTAKASELMDMSIIDMADNVNKMGTSMEAVQNAYRGFARSNYTMLDNLALGYAGTKEGMQELLNKAQEISGFEYNIDSYADIVQAIHVVQEEMGITGTTQKEAEGTITGSLASVKSAWENLMVGLASGNADIDGLITNLVDSASAMASNMLPTIERALLGVADLLDKLVPIIAERLPDLIDKLLPTVINVFTSLVQSLAKALPKILRILIKELPRLWSVVWNELLKLLPELVQLAVEMITTLAQGLGEALPTLIPAIVDIIVEIVNVLTDPNNLGLLIDAAIAITLGLAEGLINAMPKLIEAVPLIVMNLVQALIENTPKLLVATLELLIKLGEYILLEFPNQITSLIPKLFIGICEGVTNAEENLADSFYEVFMAVSDVIGEFITDALQWGKDLIDNFVDGITGGIDKVKKGAKDVANTVKDFLGFSEPDEGPLSNFHTYAPDMIDLFVKGINENVDRIGTAFTEGLDFSKSMARAEMPTIQAKPVASTEGANITIPVYIGQDKIDEIVVNSLNEYNFRTGGR